MLRIPGGPLRHEGSNGVLWLDGWPSGWGSSEVTAGSDAGLVAGDSVATGVGLANAGPWTATVERVSLLDPSDGLTLSRALLAGPGSGLPGLVRVDEPEYDELVRDFSPLPQQVQPDGGPEAARLALEVTADSPGSFGFTNLAVEYRVGPFRFVTTYHLALGFCAGPLPQGQICSWDIAHAPG